MSTIRVTKEFSFEMAHALWNYDGACKNLHGHSYKLFVTVIGQPVSDSADPKLGMVIDFSVLKKLVNENVVKKYDHAVVLNSLAETDELKKVKGLFDKKVIVNFQPTCENMLIDIAGQIQNLLPVSVKLYSVKLCETTSSYVEWFAEDN